MEIVVPEFWIRVSAIAITFLICMFAIPDEFEFRVGSVAFRPRAFASTLLSALARPVEVITWPFRFVMKPRWPWLRYGLLLLVFGSGFVVALEAGSALSVASLYVPSWIFGSVIALLTPVSVFVEWNLNENKRDLIVKKYTDIDADSLPDLRDEVLTAAFLLFPAFGVLCYRLAPSFQFSGAEHATLLTWLAFTLDQFLHALILDVLEVMDWRGFSGVTTPEGLSPERLTDERILVASMRAAFSILFVSTVFRLVQIRQAISSSIDVFERDPEIAARFGRRALAKIKAYLEDPSVRSQQSASLQVATIPAVYNELLLQAASPKLTPAREAIAALMRLGLPEALPVIVRRLRSYAARTRWEHDSDYGDSSGLPSDDELGIQLLVQTLEAYGELAARYVMQHNSLPDEVYHEVAERFLRRANYHGPSWHHDRRVRAAVARACRALLASPDLDFYKFDLTVLGIIAGSLEFEEDPYVIREMLRTLALTGATQWRWVDGAAALLDRADSSIVAEAERYLVGTNSVHSIGEATLRRLASSPRGRTVSDVIYMMSLSRDPDGIAVAGELLSVPRDEQQESRLIRYLGQPNWEQAVEILASILTDVSRHPWSRAHAAASLQKVGSSRAVPALLSVLSEDDSPALEYSCGALGELNAQEAIPLLVGLLQSKSDAFIERLKLEGWPRGNSQGADDRDLYLASPSVVFLAVIDALGKLRARDAVSALLDIIVLPSRELQNWVAVALLRIRAERSLPALLNWWRNEPGSNPFPTMDAVEQSEARLFLESLDKG